MLMADLDQRMDYRRIPDAAHRAWYLGMVEAALAA